MRAWLQRSQRWVEPVMLAAAAAWTLWFFWLQTRGLFDAHYLEWDARAHTLSAWRYHGTGLFPDDLLVDFAAVYYPPGVKLVYWIGTLFANPHWICKFVPFVLGGVVVWQTYALCRALGGRILGAAAVVLLFHCLFVWGRIVGLDARAFGFPLMISFLRYTVEKRERPALAILLAETFFYPSTFLVCAPAYGATLLWPWKLDRRWLRYLGVVALGLIVLAVTALRVDARIGHPILLSELGTLQQRGIVGTWPLPPAADVMWQAVRTSLHDDYGDIHWLVKSPARENGTILAVVAALLALVLLRRWRTLGKVPIVFPAMFVGSLVAFGMAQWFPYRLYIPERMLQYAWPPLLIIGFLLLAYLALSTLTPRWAGTLAALLVCAIELGLYGNGFVRDVNVHNWHSRDTPVVQFVATLPKDVTVAASFDTSSSIQTFARRKVLFSSILNTPIHYPIALELERRIREFYAAYYARDLGPVRAMMAADHVDYLVVDSRDFGPDADKRAEYLMWTSLARSLLGGGPRDMLVFAHPPEPAVVFRSGPVTVIDLHKL
ncbi:MAG TPA: hypothetical protein VHB97_05165 [Polyangia bacterium]|nr:hypothetical protein [Polyangia bacterium]